MQQSSTQQSSTQRSLTQRSPTQQSPMQDLLEALLARAWRERIVLTQAIDAELLLLVYPDGEHALLGLGYDGAHAHRLPQAALLRRRAARIATLGDWLPACFVDGSAYLVRRIAAAQPAAWPDEAELLAVRELLA